MKKRERQDLYISFKNKLLDMIIDGVYNKGDFLPSERELADKHNLSRITIRKALELLGQEGLISKEHGRGNRVQSSQTKRKTH